MPILLLLLGLMVLGIGVGIFSTGLGLGGGVLMVPAFITFLPEMDLHTAKGTSLFVILLVALSGLPRLYRAQAERPALRTAGWLAGGAVAGGYAGAAISTRLPEKAVLIFFLLFVGFLAFQLVWRKPVAPVHHHIRHGGMTLFLIGAAAGAVGSATGTGGGAVLAPLILLSGLLPHSQMVYVSNQVIIATSLAAAPAHLMAEAQCHRYLTVGHVALGLIPVLFLAAQVGVILGVRINLHLKARQRRLLLALVLVLVAMRMLAQL